LYNKFKLNNFTKVTIAFMIINSIYLQKVITKQGPNGPYSERMHM